jgi:uncharacterized protein with FMN-binding domain
MTRAPVVLAATAAGLAAVLSYRPHPAVPALTAAPPAKVAPGSRTFLGPVERTRYGPVQVRITVAGSKVTEVTATQLPQRDAHSAQISIEAGPLLRGQALTAQSAHVDGVSGATYTSTGYRESLTAALHDARL